jgi:hypothetical protein
MWERQKFVGVVWRILLNWFLGKCEIFFLAAVNIKMVVFWVVAFKRSVLYPCSGVNEEEGIRYVRNVADRLHYHRTCQSVIRYARVPATPAFTPGLTHPVLQISLRPPRWPQGVPWQWRSSHWFRYDARTQYDFQICTNWMWISKGRKPNMLSPGFSY